VKPVKVLIIDDSKLIQEVLSKILSEAPWINVVGCADDPYQARTMIKDLKPDVLTLDVEMPKMNGITFLRNLMRLNPLPVVMISTLTTRASTVTMQALEYGAIDFVGKPSDLNLDTQTYRHEILEKIATASRVSKNKLVDIQKKLHERHETQAGLYQDKSAAPQKEKIPLPDGWVKHRKKIIAIGGSTGSLEALKDVLSQVKFTGLESMVVCLHLPGSFTLSYAKRLNKMLPIEVKEAEHNEEIKPGYIYIAPGGKHLKISRGTKGYICVVDSSEPVNLHRPSVDVMFNSIANSAGQHALGIMLTGMGKDGAKGMLNMHKAGSNNYAQDEKSSVVWGMPGAATKLNAIQSNESLSGLALKIMQCYKE
jgi:two-component system chemotaxis response regulator CheB